MNLKEYSSDCIYPYPAIKDLRQYFLKHDKSIFLNTDFAEMSYIQKFQFFIQNYIRVYSAIVQQHPSQAQELIDNIQFISPMGTIYLTFNGFKPPLKLLSTPEQYKKWEELIYSGRLIGAYAQTEIGHGSDVQSLQLTATYDKQTKTFVLNSPSTRSIKFWPGSLGIQATHAVCQAQTYIEGKHHGLQTFVVPLRDPQTFKQYDGVDAGDIGPKLAYSWGDNGYLKLTNYRIPRENLLMKFIKVEEDGTVTSTSDKNAIKIGYGGMLGLRVALSTYFLVETYRGIILGYRQWKISEQLDSMKRRKLLKGFAFIYCGMSTLQSMTLMHRSFNENIHKNVKKALEEMVELHLLASALKAVYSWGLQYTLREYGVDQTLGNLLVTGITGLYGDTVPGVTYEGENSVMLQQTARGLCKYLQDVENEEFKKVPESFRFLVDLRGLLEKVDEMKGRVERAEELLSYERIEELIDMIGLFNVRECYEAMKEKIMGGNTVNVTWNEKLQGRMVEMALEVSRGLTFKMTKKILLNEEKRKAIAEKDHEILRELLLVYGLDILQRNVNLAGRFKIGGEPQRLGEIIAEAQETVAKRLEGRLDYIADSTPLFEEELYYVRNYKTWSPLEKVDDRIKVSLEKNKQSYIHTFSKL